VPIDSGGACSEADIDQHLLLFESGVLYGTTAYGGGTGCSYGPGCGTVFKITLPTADATVVPSFFL
jgi:hypothetical protein